MKYILRYYQNKAIALVKEKLREGKRRIIIGLSTGSGKTSTACGIIDMALAKGSKVAFVCNRIQLIQQSYETFFNQGFHDIGMIQGENTHNVNAKLLVCSIQSIAKRGLPEDIKVVIEDECHAVAGSQSYWPIMVDRVVIGLTATPQQKGLGRHNEMLGGPLFEELVSGITMKELTEQGFLVPMVAYGPNEVADLSKVRTVAGEYKEDELGEAMNKTHLVGDVVKQWFKYAHNKQTMAFCVTIAHSMSICEAFQGMGVNAVHVDYRMTDDQKKKIYSDFKEGKTMVLCNCALLSEGSDFPAAECIVLARPTKSEVRFIQMVGRVLRPSPGKDHAIVLDHGGCIARFGFPDDIHVDKLDDGKPKKSDSERKEKEKEEPKPKECPQCKYLMRVGMKVCVSCGWSYKPKSTAKHSDEDLIEIQRKGAKKKATAKTQPLAQTEREKTLAMLKHYAHARGYKDGWYLHKYKEVYGYWPKGNQRNVAPMEPSPELLIWLRSQQKSQRGW